MTKGQFSRVYLGNTLRWVRNLLKRGFHTKYMQLVVDSFKTLPNPPHLAVEIARWFTRDMTKFLKSYLRILSGRMTWFVKRVLNSSRRTLPSGGSGLGSSITKILAKNRLSIKNVGIKGWGKVRKQWRDGALQALQQKLGGIDIGALANHAVKEARAGLSPERIIKLLFNFRPNRMKLGAGDLMEFKAFLVKCAINEIEHRLITFLKPRLVPTIQQVLTALQGASRGWVQLPQFKKQSIPFGVDDRRVYRDADLQDLYILALQEQGVTMEEIVRKLIKKLPKQWRENPKTVAKIRKGVEELIKHDEETHWLEKIKKRKAPIRLQLRLERGNPMWFELKTPKRFLKLVQAGYAPQKATLLKKAGGGLILALPFEKEVPRSQCLEPSDLPQMQDPTAGLDLGLKTLAVLSIGKGDQTGLEAWGQAGREIARYFIDQKELLEKRSEWFKSNAKKATIPNPKKIKHPNYKGRLVTLQRAASAYQAERDAYRNALRERGINHRHARKFFDLNRNVKHIWRNVHNLHEELARQVATRVIAACKYHRVRVLRMEDLRWAKHARKQKAGYFLATWQIHWFFGQIQEHIADLAPRKGLFVEWVIAKHTSKRCSRCGKLGQRKGKIFKCPHCGFQLDSDLNAARNIRVAPRSDIPPSLYALAGGSPSLPQ
ncbi:MAG: transposase [Candidatus Helarchaeota archaeon]|nr:transposase [Candidatus Helarchaeota archaeon]